MSRYDLAALRRDLDGIKVVDNPQTVRKKSRDFFWYSPVLRRQLDHVVGDLFVSPTSEAELIQVLKAAYRHDVPVTVRGGGTGNYGQAMPLSGGIVLNTLGLSEVSDIGPGRVTVGPGAFMVDVDRNTIPQTGQELRLFPSTYKSATIGGFVAGGSGGVGSVTWGGLRDLGNILELRLVTMEAEPRIITLTGEDVHKANHAYGTTGVITALQMPLAPAYQWVEFVVGFDDFMTSAHYGNALARQDAILKKLVTPIAAPIAHDYLTRHAKFFRRDHSVVLCMIAAHAVDAFMAFTRRWSGAEILFRTDGDVDLRGLPPLYEHSWNHTTLRALLVDDTITYLQVLYPFPDHLALVEKMHRSFGDEVPGHLEFARLDGDVTCFGLPLVRFTTEQRLAEIIRFHEDNGCPIFNPHRYTLEEGGMKQPDALQLDFKRQTDPKGLLNPGKMIAWDDPEFDLSSERTYLYPGLQAGR